MKSHELMSMLTSKSTYKNSESAFRIPLSDYLLVGLQSKLLDSIEIEVLDLGTKPLRIGGIKTYETKDDEVIVEAPILWGSDCRVGVA